MHHIIDTLAQTSRTCTCKRWIYTFNKKCFTVSEREERPAVCHELQADKGGVLQPNLKGTPKAHQPSALTARPQFTGSLKIRLQRLHTTIPCALIHPQEFEGWRVQSSNFAANQPHPFSMGSFRIHCTGNLGLWGYGTMGRIHGSCRSHLHSIQSIGLCVKKLH